MVLGARGRARGRRLGRRRPPRLGRPARPVRRRRGEPEPRRLAVYDLLGREVAVLLDDPLPTDDHEAVLGAAGFASGVYVYRPSAGDYRPSAGDRHEVRRLTIVR